MHSPHTSNHAFMFYLQNFILLEDSKQELNTKKGKFEAKANAWRPQAFISIY